MTAREFQKYMYRLGCTSKDVTHVSKLIGKLNVTYPWVNVDELLTLGLECVPRATDTYKVERGTAFTTHLVTVTRNACLSYLKKEERQRLMSLVVDDSSGAVENGSNPVDTVTYEDELNVLQDILSPYAWQLLNLIRNGLPEKLTARTAGSALGLNPISIKHLQDEIRRGGELVFGKQKTER